MFCSMKELEMFRKKIINQLNDKDKTTWYSDPSEIIDCPKKGYYFFRKKNNRTAEGIVYIGVGGIGKKKTLLERVKQYYRPRDKGTRYFKMKALEIEPTENNWEKYKKNEFKNKPEEWKEFIMNTYEVCVLDGNLEKEETKFKKILLANEGLLIGTFNPIYNY